MERKVGYMFSKKIYFNYLGYMPYCNFVNYFLIHRIS